MEWTTNMKKELLIETRHFSPKPLSLLEGMKNNGNVFVEGILATVEERNGNGRYYPRELWEREIDKFSEKINCLLQLIELRYQGNTDSDMKEGSRLYKLFNP